MSNFLSQLEARDVDIVPSSLLVKKAQHRGLSMFASSPSPLLPQNLIAVDQRSSVLYVASYPIGQEGAASMPEAENVARVYAYPYAGTCPSKQQLPVEIITPHRRHPFIPRALALSPGGDYLAVVGATAVEIVKVLPVARALAIRGISRPGDVKQKFGDVSDDGDGDGDGNARQAVIPESDRADSFGVETMKAPSFSIRIAPEKSTAVVHVAWHPLSYSHVVVLTSDNVLSMYNVLSETEPLAPEQAISLSRSGGAVHFAFACDTAGALAGNGPELLEKNSAFLGWNVLTCFVLYEDGNVDAVCPVIPCGVCISKRIREDISVFAQSEIDELSDYVTDDVIDDDNDDEEEEEEITVVSSSASASVDNNSSKNEATKFIAATLANIIDNSINNDRFVVFKKDAVAALKPVSFNVIPALRSSSAARLVYCFGSPSVLIRIARNGTLDVYVLCADMSPRWESSPPSSSVSVAVVARGIRLCTDFPVTVDPAAASVICRADGGQIFVSASRAPANALCVVDTSRMLGALRGMFASGAFRPLRPEELCLPVSRVDVGARVFGFGFHGAAALLVLREDGRLRILPSCDVCRRSAQQQQQQRKKKGCEEPLRLEISGPSEPGMMLLCERLYGKGYLDMVVDINALVAETKKRYVYVCVCACFCAFYYYCCCWMFARYL